MALANYDIENKDLDFDIEDEKVKLDLRIILNTLQKIQEAITDIDQRLDSGGH